MLNNFYNRYRGRGEQFLGGDILPSPIRMGRRDFGRNKVGIRLRISPQRKISDVSGGVFVNHFHAIHPVNDTHNPPVCDCILSARKQKAAVKSAWSSWVMFSSDHFKYQFRGQPPRDDAILRLKRVFLKQTPESPWVDRAAYSKVRGRQVIVALRQFLLLLVVLFASITLRARCFRSPL